MPSFDKGIMETRKRIASEKRMPFYGEMEENLEKKEKNDVRD